MLKCFQTTYLRRLHSTLSPSVNETSRQKLSLEDEVSAGLPTYTLIYPSPCPLMLANKVASLRLKHANEKDFAFKLFNTNSSRRRYYKLYEVNFFFFNVTGFLNKSFIGDIPLKFFQLALKRVKENCDELMPFEFFFSLFLLFFYLKGHFFFKSDQFDCLVLSSYDPIRI